MGMRTLAKQSTQEGLGALSQRLEKTEAVVEALAKQWKTKRENDTQRVLNGLNLAICTGVGSLEPAVHTIGRAHDSRAL